MKKQIKNKTDIKIGDNIWWAGIGRIEEYTVTGIKVLSEMFVDITCVRFPEWKSGGVTKYYEHVIVKNEKRPLVFTSQFFLNEESAKDWKETQEQQIESTSAMNGLINFLEFLLRDQNSDIAVLLNRYRR